MDLTKLTKAAPIILTILIITSFLAPVFGTGLLASPTEFKVKLKPSQTSSGELIIENIGDVETNVTIEHKRLLMDNIHMEFSDGGIANWISVYPSNFTIKSREKKTVYFNITAPENINYYDAVGALIIRGVPGVPAGQTNPNAPNVVVQQGIELIIPIVAGLPGPIIESLQFLEHSAPMVLITYMPGDFIYHVKNNGTVYANMTGNIEINGLISDHKVPIEGGVYPEDQYYANATWEPGFSDFGLYSADTTIKYGRYQQTQTLQTHDTILVIPVWLIILIILAVVIWYIRKKEIKSPVKIKIERK